jgi:flagellar biosynthesis/type III secretory pathway protein FliH
MFRRLEQADKKNLFVIGYRIALRVLEEIDQQWLEEMFMNDENSFTPLEIWEIFEGTWMQDAIIEKFIEREIKQGREQELEQRMKRWLEQGEKRGLEQGEKRGLEQGLHAIRANLLSFVKTHFSDELALANQQVGLIMTLSQAQELSEKLFVARTDNEVKAILLSLPHA